MCSFVKGSDSSQNMASQLQRMDTLILPETANYSGTKTPNENINYNISKNMQVDNPAALRLIESFIMNLKTHLADISLIIVSLGSGHSKAKQNNRTVIPWLISKIVQDGRSNDSQLDDHALVCFNKSLQRLRLNIFGLERVLKLDRVIYNCMDTRGRYKSIIKSLENILNYTKQVIIFVPQKIPQQLLNVPEKYKCKHFKIVGRYTLDEVHLDSYNTCQHLVDENSQAVDGSNKVESFRKRSEANITPVNNKKVKMN